MKSESNDYLLRKINAIISYKFNNTIKYAKVHFSYLL